MNRTRDVISDEEDRNKEFQYINNVLSANGYKQDLIKKIKRKTNNGIRRENITTEEVKANINIPYVPGVSDTLKRIFRKHNIKCTFNSKETLRKILSHPKDKLQPDHLSNVVYEIPCSNCDAVYIGETKRRFKQRAQEHIRAVRNADTEKNEIAHHCWTKDHRFNFDEKKIIDIKKRGGLQENNT